MKEHTRAFFNNEVDVHISLNKILKDKFCFDQTKQQLKANEHLLEGDHIKKYIGPDEVFDCKKYTQDFMECLEISWGSLTLAKDTK